MFDMTAIGAMLTSLKTALDIAKAMKDLNAAEAIQGQIFEMQAKMIAVQASAMQVNDERASLIERISQLEAEITRMKTWDRNKQQYKLHQVDPGAFAYVPKPETEAGEEPHWLCANCYEDGKKSHLQLQGRTPDRNHNIYLCTRCKGGFKTSWNTTPKKIEKPA